MKLKNPNHVNEVQQFIADRKAGIAAYFANNANLEYIDFDKIRADFPLLADRLTDGVIHQICIDLGIDVQS